MVAQDAELVAQSAAALGQAQQKSEQQQALARAVVPSAQVLLQVQLFYVLTQLVLASQAQLSP